MRPDARGPVNQPVGGNDPGGGPIDWCLTQLAQFLQRTRAVAHRGDTGGQEMRAIPRLDVAVHVDQARHDPTTRHVDNICPVRDANFRGGAHGCDALVSNQQGRSGRGRSLQPSMTVAPRRTRGLPIANISSVIYRPSRAKPAMSSFLKTINSSMLGTNSSGSSGVKRRPPLTMVSMARVF